MTSVFLMRERYEHSDEENRPYLSQDSIYYLIGSDVLKISERGVREFSVERGRFSKRGRFF